MKFFFSSSQFKIFSNYLSFANFTTSIITIYTLIFYDCNEEFTYHIHVPEDKDFHQVILNWKIATCIFPLF